MNAFRGKTYVAIGDSITQGYALKDPRDNYACRLAQALGVGHFQNLGISGTTLCSASRDGAFVRRYRDALPDASLVTILGGINDFESSDPLGAFGDECEGTIYGALALLSKGLKDLYKLHETTIILITPLPMDSIFMRGDENDAGYTVRDIAQAVIDTGRAFGLDVIDLNKECGLTRATLRSALPDGQHPSAQYHATIARLLQRDLERIMEGKKG